MKCDELKAIESATAVIENVYLVYRKSEADKVIAHHKYKRCLANGTYWVAVSYQCVDDKHRQQAERHHRKWLELSKQFKEAK